MPLRTCLLKEQKELPTEVDLTGQAEKGRELAKLIQRAAAVRADHRAARSAEKAELEAIEKEIGSLSVIVAEGRELRLVDVEHWADHETGRVTSIRKDTGTVYNDRPMSAEERQLGIELVGAPATPPKPEIRDHESAAVNAGKACETCGIVAGVPGPEHQRVILAQPCPTCGATAGWRVKEPEA